MTDETTHYCARCETVTAGHWVRVRALSAGGDIAFSCEDCAQLTHPDCES